MKVHPNARGKMYKITTDRDNKWRALDLWDTASKNDHICCRHFSLAQYNVIRLERGHTHNILLPDARPDMFLPGKDNLPDLRVYQETYKFFVLLYLNSKLHSSKL